MEFFANKKAIKLALIVLAAVAVSVLLVCWTSGRFEISQINNHSLTDWHLGGKIDGVNSAEDAENEPLKHFSWFDDGKASGFVSQDGKTKYYLGRHFGKYCVIGFESSDTRYNVLGLRVGDAQIDAETALLEYGYRISEGGLNKCVAGKGKVQIQLSFDDGEIAAISVRLK